jgi:antirestriction protein
MVDQSVVTKPKIYVACLAAYNNGYLHGAWIDADRDEETIRAEIGTMLAGSQIAGAEEYAIHDYEGFGGIRIEEYASIASVRHWAAFIDEHGELGAAVLDHFSGDLEEAREAMEERYLGSYASLADYLQDLTEETMQIPEALRNYIDWQAMARDAEMSGDLFAIQTGFETVHVFSGR